jgi:hypothetical protein
VTRWRVAWFGVALVVGLASCAKDKWELSPKPVGFQQAGGSAGFQGQTYVVSTTTTSSVVSIDPKVHSLVLKHTDGTTSPYQAGQEVSNFTGIKVGDQVQTTVAQEMGVAIASSDATLSTSNNVTVVRPPNGGTPMRVETRNYIAVLDSVDLAAYTVSLKLADGTLKTVKVNQNINLADFNPGDKLAIQVSEATTFIVQKQ